MKEPLHTPGSTARAGAKVAGGGDAVGGIGLAKTGLLGKLFLWWFVWHGTIGVWRIAGWAGLAVVLAAIVAYFVVRARREG